MGPKPRSGIVAVHAGAGFHSPSKASLYKSLCKRACAKAWKLLQEGADATEVVAAAISVLEDDPATNAGYGSNLTLAGEVECDASIMDGRSLHFGAVGCASGVHNPILVACKLLDEQKRAPTLSCGRVAPCALAGSAVRQWAHEHDLRLVTDDSLISGESLRSFKKYMKRLKEDSGEEDSDCNRPQASKQRMDQQHVSEPESVLEESLQLVPPLDTVGAVCMDASGCVASGVSSGGLLLKQPGRLGQAAMYGCGCWAECDTKGGLAVAASVSGCGEHIIKTMLARQCVTRVVSAPSDDSATALHTALRCDFIGSRFLEHVPRKLAGVLMLVIPDHEKDDTERPTGELLWCHSTRSMAVGYMASQGDGSEAHESHAFVSRLGGSGDDTAGEVQREGTQCIVSGKLLRL